MIVYAPDLCTLDYVRRHRTLGGSQTSENDLLADLIREASAEFQSAIRRTCMPYLATHAFDYSRRTVKQPTRLAVDADLLELDGVTNGDGTSIGAVDTLLLPGIGYPKSGVVLKNATWVRGDIDYQCLLLEGWWGYVPHYLSCWQAAGALPDQLTSSATTVTITNATNLYETGQYWKLNDEIVQVTTIAANVVTLARAQLGTVAATHATMDAIRKYVPLPDIAGAVREIAVYKYKSKDRVGGRVQVFEGGILTTEDLDRSVADTIARHVKREILV